MCSSDLAAGDVVLYPPFDFAWVCRRFLRRLRPSALLVVETEFWPNLFWQTRRAGLPLFIVNGRISDHSWPRYARTRPLWSAVMDAVTAVYPSGDIDAQRFLQLGVHQSKLQKPANLKYRIRIPQSVEGSLTEKAAARLAQAPHTQVLVAGSTMAGEEKLLLDAYLTLRQQFPALWLILAPRHPERFDQVASLIEECGLPLRRRSQWSPEQPVQTEGVLLLDTIGELASAYQLATVAFVGGTLVPRGGHNILEPAALGKPVVIGPSMENFREIADQFTHGAVPLPLASPASALSAAVVQVSGGDSLTPALRYLLSSAEQARSVGSRGQQVVESFQADFLAVRDSIVAALRKEPASR